MGRKNSKGLVLQKITRKKKGEKSNDGWTKRNEGRKKMKMKMVTYGRLEDHREAS